MIRLFTSALLLTFAFTANAQNLSPELNFETAYKIQEGCLNYAKEHQQTMAIAVYNHHGELISFAKMDGAANGIAEVAKWKGLSAATYQVPTTVTKSWNVPNAPNISGVRGGLPIKTKDGFAIGGIGVSGAASTEDQNCANAGLLLAGLPSTIEE